MGLTKLDRRNRIRRRIRKIINGTSSQPRMSVYRSNKEIVDAKSTKIEVAANVGKRIGAIAKKAGITEVKFDRGGYLYHGRVKALADGAREGGLKF